VPHDLPAENPEASRRSFAPTRRQVLLGGAGTLALVGLSQPVARAAEAQSAPPAEGTVLELLNGTWDFMPTTGEPTAPPTSGSWADIPVPAEWNMTSGVFATSWNAYDLFETPPDYDDVDVAWYRRTVTVPNTQRGRRIVLRFEAVNFEATVFYNGVQVAKHSEGLLPFEVDVTDQVVFGRTDTVHVLVRSGNVAAKQSDGWHYPAGSWWGQTCWGIWQDVWLLSREPTYVQDSTITTSVQDSSVSIASVVANETASRSKVWVEHAITDGKKVLLSTIEQITVPANGTAKVSVAQSVSKPHLWSGTDPHLCTLTTTLRSTRKGAALDTRTVRFGFREVRVDGTEISLNGEPIKLRGDAWHYMGSIENSRAYATAWFTMAKDIGVNYIRLHAMPYPPVFYDVADEMGMLIVAESGIYGSSGNYALSSDDFFDNCDAHLTARVIRDRNHPSVIAWSAENEVLAASGQSWAAKIAALKPVIAALDSTRPIYFEGDGDPQGAGDLESTHYPLEITTSGTAIPESAYALAPGGSRASFWDRKKPMLVSEFSSMYYATPNDVSAIGGPDTFASLDGFYDAHGTIVGAQIEGFRYAGITGISPWNTVWYGLKQLNFNPGKERLPLREDGGPKFPRVGPFAATLNPGFQPSLPEFTPNAIHTATQRTLQPVAAFPQDYRQHYWSGQTLTKTYAVYDEVGLTRAVNVAWTLTVNGTKRRGSSKVSVPADGKTDVIVSVAVPEVGAPASGTLTLTVSARGATLFTDTRPVRVYPGKAADRRTKKALKAAVIEATGSTATSDALAGLGVQTRTISDLSSLPGAGEVLVVGEGATITPTTDQSDALIAFVKAGGQVVALAQTNFPNILPWPALSSNVPQTVTHVGAAHHPLLDGVAKDGLRWWQTSDETVVSSVIVKPRFGSIVSIGDSGPGLASSALAEANFGTGRYLLCQYPVVAAAEDEPIAAILLRNIVDRLTESPTGTNRRLGVLAGDSSSVPTVLTGSAVASTAITSISASTLADVDVLLVDAAPGNESTVALLPANAAALQKWLHAGGTLWVNGATPDTLALVGDIAPAGVSLTPVDAGHQLGAVNTGADAYADGLNNADLDWIGSTAPLVQYSVSGRNGSSAVDTRAVDWTAFVQGAEQNKYGAARNSTVGFTPGSALWSSPVGSGRILFDQLGWSVALPLPKQTGVLASIAAGLGVAFDTGVGTGLLSTDGWTPFTNPDSGQGAQAYDRDSSTRWSSIALQQPGMYYGVDFGAVHTINRIVWDDALAPGDLPNGVKVEISTNGTDYTTVLTVSDVSSVSSAGVMTLSLTPVAARYLRMTDLGSTGGYLSLYELYVYAQ
jgi:beta-galactosidase